MTLPLWGEGIWFAVSLLTLTLLQRAVHRLLQAVLLLGTWNSRVAFALYVILLFPGVAFHEASHALASTLLGVRVRSFSLRPARQAGGMVRFGSVTTDRADPIRAALIGSAPILFGSAAMLAAYAASGLGDVVSQALQTAGLEGAIEMAGPILRGPASALWIYICLAVGNNMIPSSADRSAWLAAGLILLACVAGVVLVGAEGTLASWALPGVEAIVRGLAGAFTLIVVLDGLLLAGLALMVRALEGLTGRRVVVSG